VIFLPTFLVRYSRLLPKTPLLAASTTCPWPFRPTLHQQLTITGRTIIAMTGLAVRPIRMTGRQGLLLQQQQEQRPDISLQKP